MQLLTRRSFLELTAAAGGVALANPAFAAGHASAQVFTADPQGGLVDSTVVIGENSAVLIDAQFTAPNASALADVIAATGKTLETVFQQITSQENQEEIADEFVAAISGKKRKKDS